jgi:hypothetical protein
MQYIPSWDGDDWAGHEAAAMTACWHHSSQHHAAAMTACSHHSSQHHAMPCPSPQVTSHAHTARGRSTWTRIYRWMKGWKTTQLIFLRLETREWTIQMQYITDRWCGEHPIALEINCPACKGNYVTLNYGGVAQFTESKANQFHIFLQSFSHVFLQSDFLSPLTIGINSILIRECKPRGLWKKKLHHMHAVVFLICMQLVSLHVHARLYLLNSYLRCISGKHMICFSSLTVQSYDLYGRKLYLIAKPCSLHIQYISTTIRRNAVIFVPPICMI